MIDRPEFQGRWYCLLAPWVLLCVTLPAATGGCLRKASKDCDPQADGPQCFRG